MPDHQPLAAAGDAAGRLVWQMVQVGAPPVLAGLLVTALLAEAWAGESKRHCEPSAVVITWPPVPVPDTSWLPTGRGIDSNDIVMMHYRQRERDHWAAINASANMQNNPALWTSVLTPPVGDPTLETA